MKKIIALNWKHTQTIESARALLSTAEELQKMAPENTWILFPGDEFLAEIKTSSFQLGQQALDKLIQLPYCLVGHMSRRIDGQTNEEIGEEIKKIQNTQSIPILCVGPVKEEDTLEMVMNSQLTVLQDWPKDREIIVAYEPSFAVGSGKSMTLEDIEIVYEILSKALEGYTKKHVLYGGSVDDTNIVQILEITDGVIIGRASQTSLSLLSLSLALGQTA